MKEKREFPQKFLFFLNLPRSLISEKGKVFSRKRLSFFLQRMSNSQEDIKRTGASGEVFLIPSNRPGTPTSRKRTNPDMGISLGGGIPPSGGTSPPQDPRSPVPIPDPISLPFTTDPLALASIKFREKRSQAEKALNLVRYAEELRDALERTETDIKVLESSSPEIKVLIQGARLVFAKKRALPKIKILAPGDVDPKRQKTEVPLPSSSSSSSTATSTVAAGSSALKKTKSQKRRDKSKIKKSGEISSSKDSAPVQVGPVLSIRTQDLDS